PLPGRVLILLNLDLADIFVDRLLGGMGTRSSQQQRELTDIEISLMEGVVNRVVSSLEEAWSSMVELRARVEESALSPYPFSTQIGLPTDTCAWITFEVSMHDHASALSVCIPYSVLKPISSRLSPHSWMRASEGVDDEMDAYTRALLQTHLSQVKVPVSVQLGSVALSLDELTSLQVGDVVLLDTHVEGEAVVLVQGQEWYRARPGTHRGKIAAQITRVLTNYG
ncbi:MAG TPA: hypothetical protein EYP04_07525, partial [Anaerolineae bacterium]|nr:hypothetical protein [Anaerolineae bacterium]